MKKATVTLTYKFEVRWDPTSKAFQTTMEDYRDVINKHAEEEHVIETAVEQAFRGGSDRIIEGIGFVRCTSFCENEDLYSGIDIDDDDPMCDITIDIHTE